MKLTRQLLWWLSILVIGLSLLLILILYIVSNKYRIMVNISSSMPQRLWLVDVQNKVLRVNSYAVFKFHDYRMQKMTDYELVVKQVGGVAGVVIKVSTPINKSETARFILQGSIYPAYLSISGFKFKPLTDKDLTIPKGYYFMHGLHQPTFDSRYKEFGLINQQQIVGVAYPIF